MAVLLFALTTPVWATDYFWQSPLGGSFTTSDLWQPFDPDPPGLSYGPGGAGDTVNFNLGVAPDSRYTVTDVAGISRRLLVHSDLLTLNVSDAYRLLSASSTDPNLVVGVAAGQTGDLILTGNGLLQTWHGNISIGHAAGSSGVVTVDGLQWVGHHDLTVGNAGSGKLTIQNGGVISYTDGYIGAGPGSTGEIAVTGEGSAWTDGGIFSLGVEGTGTMTINDGGQVSNYFSMIGFASGSSGSATISGEGSMWTNYGNLIVGESGHGRLTVEAGGSVSNDEGTIGRSAGSTGDVIVTGADSTWINRGILSVGSLGAGTLTIQEGGLVSTSESFIGDSAGSTGEVTVTGAGSTWVINNLSLIVGRRGTGALRIVDGGRVASAVTTIGCFAGSTGEVTLTGIGSTWTNRRLYIGGDRFEPGTGTTGALTIEEGGHLSTATSFIGSSVGSSGVVTVKGTGSTWTNNSSLLVGHKGNGMLAIEAGGSVSNTEGYIGELEGSTGEVTVSGAGSTWTNSVNLYVGGHDSSAGGTGTLTVDSGGLVDVAGTTTVWQPGTVNLHDGALQTQWLRNYGNVILSQSTVNGPVTNHGAITAVGEVAFNDPVGGAGNFFGPGTVSFNGEFSPGASPANVAFEGNLVLAETNTLFIEIGGTTPGSEHDVLTIAGSATLDGILDVSLIDGFRPALGQQFTILTAQSILDNGITLVGNAAGFFDLLVNDSSAILQTTSAGLPGDFNGDGTVTAADYTVWRDGLGASFADSHYTQWKNNFGARVPPGVGHSTRATVPEPGTFVLWALAAILLVNRPVTQSAAA